MSDITQHEQFLKKLKEQRAYLNGKFAIINAAGSFRWSDAEAAIDELLTWVADQVREHEQTNP